MKKYIALFMVLLMLLSFAACKGSEGSATSDEYPLGTVVGEEIEWSENKADASIVGSWKLVGDEYDEYFIFTDDCRVIVAKGSVAYIGKATYGIDADGIRSYFSEFQYLSGQLTYTIEDDKLTFLYLDGTTQVFQRVELDLPELDVYDNFKADDKLVGVWYNAEYMDSYNFGQDGFARYTVNYLEEYGWSTECDYSYYVSDGKITMKHHDGNDFGEEVFDYSIEGDVLTINGNEYTYVQTGPDKTPATTAAATTGE